MTVLWYQSDIIFQQTVLTKSPTIANLFNVSFIFVAQFTLNASVVKCVCYTRPSKT